MPGSFADPFPYYRVLRATDPVHWHSRLDVWIATRYADVAAALQNPWLSSVRKRPTLSGMPESARQDAEVVYDIVASWLLHSDPPAHTRLRKLSASALRDCMGARSMRERIARTVDELLDRAASLGSMDIIADLAAPVSLDLICNLIGVPASDYGRLYEWADAVGAAAEGNPDSTRLARAHQSLLAATEYLRELVACRRRHPEPDFLTALMWADSKNETLGEKAVIGISILLLLAGHETATHLIGNGMFALLQHRHQRERLTDPGLWPTAIQELMRYASPLHGVLRRATRDLELGGKLIHEGQTVALCLAAANRDPEVFQDPEMLDLSRKPNPHIALGHGIHYCLGASFGELVTEITIRKTLERFPGLRLESDRAEWQGNYLFRSQRCLHVMLEGG